MSLMKRRFPDKKDKLPPLLQHHISSSHKEVMAIGIAIAERVSSPLQTFLEGLDNSQGKLSVVDVCFHFYDLDPRV